MKKIRIVSPAKSIKEDLVKNAQEVLSNQGYDVTIGANATGENNYFSGTDKDRLDDFQEAIDDPDLDIILCARGGYGSVRIIDKLNFEKFIEHPKLILGYSDITVFHNRMNRLGFPSGHTTAPLNFQENTIEALESLFNLIEGKGNKYEIETCKHNKTGKAKAELMGGNLSIIVSLIGTNDDIKMRGKILFLEEIGEAIYSIDRMFYSLKKAGKLDGLAGIILGGMTNLKDSAVPFGQSVKEVIKSHLDEYDYPVCFNFPAGHIDDNRALLLNVPATLEVNPNNVIFQQQG